MSLYRGEPKNYQDQLLAETRAMADTPTPRTEATLLENAGKFWSAYQLGQVSADHTAKEVFCELLVPLLRDLAAANAERDKEAISYQRVIASNQVEFGKVEAVLAAANTEVARLRGLAMDAEDRERRMAAQSIKAERDAIAANEQIITARDLIEATEKMRLTAYAAYLSAESDCTEKDKEIAALKAEAERNAKDAERGRLVVSHGSISFGPDYNTVSVRVPHVALKTVGMGSFIANVPAAIANSLDAAIDSAIAQGK